MNIIDRGRAFLQWLCTLVLSSAAAGRRCPSCGSTVTCRWGFYTRHPWQFAGRPPVRVQRYRCTRCRRTYVVPSAWLVRGSWYAREVQRCALDHWLHLGTSLRKTAEVLRSWLGRQERWCQWRPLDPVPGDAAACHLSASTVHRWLDRAGQQAQRGVPAQLAGLPTSGQFGTDGLWARLRGGIKRVVLALVDGVSGIVWPPVVVPDETPPQAWQHLCRRAQTAGLDLETLRGIVSDGVVGLEAYRRRHLRWVSHQRCVWHLWRQVGQLLPPTPTPALRQTLVTLIPTVFDAPQESAVASALARLATLWPDSTIAPFLATHQDAARVHRCGYNQGLPRVAPEWCWRDFRLRLSHGRNHGSAPRLERAALVWAIYHNFTPTQARYERTRHYRHPGPSPLAVAGASPGTVSYLDALAV